MEMYSGGSLAISSPSRKLSAPKCPHAGHARGMGSSIGILQWAHRVLTLGCDGGKDQHGRCIKSHLDDFWYPHYIVW